MFETIIALFIKRYVARYININADQLSAQLLYKQQIIIENLTLNKEMLNEDIQTKFKLPLKIESVHIDKIQCSFVLSSLFFRSSSAALIIKIEGVHAIIKSAVIDDDNDSSLETIEENNIIQKRNQLNLAEQQLEKEFECFGEVKSSRWNVQRLFMSFFEKLQIEIVDIHISYESSTFYKIGFTSDSIQITNEASDETMSRQVFRIINPGIYIDINNPSTHSYILSPSSSMEIYLIHNHFLASQKEYRYEFEYSLNDLNMKFNIEQVRIIVDIIRSIQQSSLHRMLISDPSRPHSKISKQSAKSWWRYAILTVLRTQVDSVNFTTTHFWFDRSLLIHRLHLLNTYQRLYRAYIDNKYFKYSNFSSENELTMNEIELEFDIKYLLIVRRSIFQTRINEELNQKKETDRWYSNYAKWITTKVIDLWGKTPATENSNTILNENDMKLQEQVNIFIAQSLADEDLLESCQNALIFRFKFVLKSVQIDLLSSSNDILFTFYLTNLLSITEFRLRHRSILASVCLEDLYIRDQGQIDEFAKIICSKERLQQVPVFELSFEKKGKSKSSKQSLYSIGIRSCGLCIVCCPATMERLHHFYISIFGPSSRSLSLSFYKWKQIKNYTVKSFISILEQIIPKPTGNKATASYLRNRYREKKKFQIYVDIGAPKIIVPLLSNGALIVDLGCVTLTNDTLDQNDAVTALSNTVFDQQRFQENDDEEFLTPDSSPLTNDNPFEEESTYYSINVISPDIEYSSFSLSIRDIQVGYSIDLSQIVEKFSIHFLVQHPLDHLWPLVNISSTIQKITVHLNSQIIQTLCSSIHPWLTFIDNIIAKQHHQSHVWPAFDFHLDEMCIILNDKSQALCDIRMQNIDLSLTNNLICTLQIMTIFNCMEQGEKKYEFILKTDRTTNINENFIRINADLSARSKTHANNLIIDVNADKLNFIFNPKTICALANFLFDINPLSLNQTIFEKFSNRTNQIHCKINCIFRELNIFVTDITSMVLLTEVHLQNISLNILLNPFSTFEVTITAIQILDLVSNPQQSTIALSIDHEVSQNTALNLLLTNMENNKHNLSMKIASISYIYSLRIIYAIQQIVDYMTQSCHLITKQRLEQENQFTSSTLHIDLNTLKIVFPVDIILQLDHIRIRNSPNRLSDNGINMDLDYPSSKKITLQLDSLQIKDHSINSDETLVALAFIELNYNQHERIDVKLSKFDIKFVKSTWIILSKIISIIDSETSEIRKRKQPSIEIWINVDSISCLFQDNTTLLMNIDLQRFSGHIRTCSKQSIVSSTIHGQLDFISIHDLTTVDQLYSERLCTTGTHAVIFSFTVEKDHSTDISVGSQFHLRMTSIQYIHTQSFLLSLIDYFRSFIIIPVISDTNQRLNGIFLNVEIENMILILPEHILKRPVLILQLGYINFQNKSNIITSQMKNIEFYSSSHCLVDEKTSTSIYFSNFGFSRMHNELSSMIRQPFHLNMEIEHNLDNSINHTSPTYIIKMNLSSIDILFDFNHYNLIQNILIHNLNKLFNSLIVLKDDIYTDLACIIEIDHVGLEIFMLDIDLLSFDHRRSIGYTALTNLHLSFDQHTNGNQTLHLLCSTVKLIDTRIENDNMIIPLSMPSNSSQLELYLLRTKLDNQCTITINSMRLLFVIDWLLEFNEFLNLFCRQENIITPDISIPSLEIKLYLNRFELVLVPTIKDPYSNTLIYSSTMVINYKKSIQPFECLITDLTFLSCQIGNIDETAVTIIEPTDCSLNIQTSNEISGEKICELNFPILNIRLSYSDIKMIYSLIHTISKQISQAKTRKPLLTFISSILTSPIRNLQSSIAEFLNIKFLKFLCDEICLCLIDDCFGVNIPLLNINLKSFILQTIENNHLNRTDQCEFELQISYYNRFQSGFEPLIELCSLSLALNRSQSSTLIFISSKDKLNLNFTKAMYKLYDTIKTNWYTDYQNSKKDIESISSKKKVGFRCVKPLDPYCFKNLLGIRIKFCTWMTDNQCFSSFENIVDDNQTISFCFPRHSNSHSHIRIRSNSLVTSLFQSDRRLLISIDGWETLQPISIDRIGTFVRLAKPLNNHQLYKSILVIIDIAMTNSSIRSITIRSSIEIRNQLLTSIDMKFISKSNSTYEFSLESNEIRSLPIQFCSILKQIQIRRSNFSLDYCDDPINWFEIENTKTCQSFLCTCCSFDGKETVYYVCLQSKQTCLLNSQDQSYSIYQLTIHPPLTIYNLLPCKLNFQILSSPQKFELNPYKFHREHKLNILQNLDILFTTKIYHMNKSLHLPTINELYKMKYTHERVIFYDNIQRELMVDITIECVIKHRLKISVSVPYVLLNKSGIPLIFKDTNSKIEVAGQNIDDESIVNREPLLFSFDNSNRNNTCIMKVGTGLHHHQEGRPQWSQRFRIEHGSTYRELQVRSPRNLSDWNYSIGIDVRRGNGQLKKINFIYLSARYIICNQCSYDLWIAQRSIKDDNSNCVHISKHATVAYHWPCADIEQLLCVRAIDNHQYGLMNWSGGFQIDCVNVFHINMRYENGQCLIFRVQIIERNGTYFVVFMDSNQMPSPFRIYNRSDIPIQFYQTEIREEFIYLRTVIQPYQSIDYALDEPALKPMITCSILDGTKATYDLLKLGPGDDLKYQNYIYLTFQEIFDYENHQLVIEYTDNRLLLAQRQENKRSQLWQMTNNGLLIHVGSSSVQDLNKKKDFFDDIRQAFVLDIEDLTDNVLNTLKNNLNKLTVRRYDPKRVFTQTWQFVDNGYLCMSNTQLCIQIFGELKPNSDVVLGFSKNENQLPLPTMHIRSHQRYNGSGILSVRVIADGPTNVLEIDHKKISDLPIIPTITSPLSTIYQLNLDFSSGVGISVIGSIGYESEELIYILVDNLHIEYNDKDNEQSIEATINTLIISNQLLSTIKPCFFYTSFTDDSSIQPAIRLQINWQKFNNNFTLLHIIHSLHLDINPITIQLDEILLWKLIEFFNIEISSLSSLLFTNTDIDRRIDLNINDYETERILSLLTSTHATRIYFNKLYLSSIELNLSVYCIHSKRSLSPNLLGIKRRTSFPLVPFENAQIHLKSYEQTHISNTYDFILLSIMQYYVNVGKRQIFKIIGSVNFLGNPLGFIHDVSDGLTCLVDQGSVSGLVKNVTHGVANSTSKVTGSLSHGLGKLVSDNDQRQTSTDHHRNPKLGHVIRHGTAGLAAGFYGGLTSIIKQPYKGVVKEGVPGLVKGFAKGIVGTVSKPMVSILDFTNEMAMIIKEGSRSSNTILNNRIRLTRCPCNTLGLLQSFSIFDAQGHDLLYKINKGNITERYISRLTLSTLQTNPSDKQRNTDAMITTQRVILYRINDDPDVTKFEILDSYDFNTPMKIIPIEENDNSASIQIILNSKYLNYHCDTFEQAIIFSREVQRAQDIFQDEKLVYIPSDDENEDFDE